ncbi:MAG: radical SAM protein [Syntrophorhabdaceae bacterium]|nr:radical SAM protein [Syntrophorhabdaceae bacterium]
MESIFVSIASYRDNELPRTIADCISKAMHPERLVFGIHWQHDSHEFFEQLYDRRCKVIDTDYRTSKGACWARHEAQKLYAGEDYVLQIDSHMRFVRHWDFICEDGIRELQHRGNKRVIISNLMPSYDPDDDTNLSRACLTCRLGRFNQDGALALKASVVTEAPERFSPGMSISAAFLFSIGALYKDVRIDPDLYFDGEEISFAVRAYTHGYDLYHCNYPIVYHYYTRRADRKHWDDHGDWGKRSILAKARMRSLLMETNEVPDLGPYGLGTVRSLADYERYSGVDFKRRTVSEPGDASRTAGTGENVRSRLVAGGIGVAQIDPFSYCNARCWYCPVRYHPQPVEARHHMPIALFERIIRELCEERDKQGLVNAGFNFIYTAHYNEILLYRHLAEMFEVLRRYGLRTLILSNGIALSKDKVDLIKDYNDVVGEQVCLNISAFERERWIANTVAGNGSGELAKRRAFNRTMKNIEYASRQLGALSIQINEANPDEAEKQADIARQMFPGATVRTCLTLSDRAGILHEAGAVSNREEIGRMSAGRSRVTDCSNTFTGIGGRHFGWLHVNALGKALLCCNDYYFDYTFGDFHTDTLKDIWLSERHATVIERSFREICRKCSMAVWK